MNNSNSDFHNNKLKIENVPSKGESTNICIIQKSNTGHSSSNSINKKQSSNNKLNFNNEPSISSKGINIPKINLLKTTKSMSQMTFLSNSKNVLSKIENNNYCSNNNNSNNQIKISNVKSKKNLKINSSNKLRTVIDLNPVSDIGIDIKNNANYNNSFLNESSYELVSNREKDQKTANLDNIYCSDFYKENFLSNIEIKENLILENRQIQEEEDDDLYSNGFENIENSNVLNENKKTIDVSINNSNTIIIKENTEDLNNNIINNINDNDCKHKANENNSVPIKERKNINHTKETYSSLQSRKNRVRGFNNTFAKSLSPSKLSIPHGKLVSEFNTIKEVEENKVNSPDPKASAVYKNSVSFNNPTKMNLFCINKEKYYLVIYWIVEDIFIN